MVRGVPIVSGMISEDCGFDDLPAFRRDMDVVDPIPVRPSIPTTESTSQFHPRVQLAKGIAKRFPESFDREIVFSSIEIPHEDGGFVGRFSGRDSFKTKHGAFFSGRLTLMIEMGVVEEEGASCFLVLESSPGADTGDAITP